MRIFLADASGVIGIRLLPLLVEQGHVVAAMTRAAEKADDLRTLGGEPVVCDVFDADRLTEAVGQFQPDAVMHQLTDLPDRVDELAAHAAHAAGIDRRARTPVAAGREARGSGGLSASTGAIAAVTAT